MLFDSAKREQDTPPIVAPNVRSDGIITKACRAGLAISRSTHKFKRPTSVLQIYCSLLPLGVAKACFFFSICNRMWGGLFGPEFWGVFIVLALDVTCSKAEK